MAVQDLRLYGHDDPRDVPAYGMSEASRYLGIPASTLRSWTIGQQYRVRGQHRFFAPVIQIADPGKRFLSFWNLFEAYVCDALRCDHNISLQKIRSAIQFIRRTDPKSKHPLVEKKFATVGVELFIEEYSHVIGASNGGQLGIRAVLEQYLRRVDRDRFGRVARLYPFTRTTRSDEAPRVVVLDPLVFFGRPVISGTRIATAIVYERWKAGESVSALVADYQRSSEEIEEALRCENTGTQAA